MEKHLLKVLILCIVFVSLLCLGLDEKEILDIPTNHQIVTVSTALELANAVANIESHTTILIESGSYRLLDTPNNRIVTRFGKSIEDIAIRGKSTNPADVIIYGEGMLDDRTQFGIQLDTIDQCLIAYLTIHSVYYSGIQTSSNTENLRIYNCIIRDTGQQNIKINPTTSLGYPSSHIIEFCHIYYTTSVPSHPKVNGGSCYTNGISAHYVSGLIVRHNVFENFICASNELCGPPVLIWNDSEDSEVYGNSFINTDRGIYLGMSATDHTGGIAKNNVFWRQSGKVNNPDALIYTSSPNSKIFHNTIWSDDLYYAPIEVRYTTTTNVEVFNNLLSDGIIAERENPTVTTQNNILNAEKSWFVDWSVGNLRVVDGITQVIDQVVPLADCKEDFDGKSRPTTGADIGAFEYGDGVVCSGNYDKLSDCSTCVDYWDLASGCSVCPEKYAIVNGQCNSCKNINATLPDCIVENLEGTIITTGAIISAVSISIGMSVLLFVILALFILGILLDSVLYQKIKKQQVKTKKNKKETKK